MSDTYADPRKTAPPHQHTLRLEFIRVASALGTTGRWVITSTDPNTHDEPVIDATHGMLRLLARSADGRIVLASTNTNGAAQS